MGILTIRLVWQAGKSYFLKHTTIKLNNTPMVVTMHIGQPVTQLDLAGKQVKDHYKDY